jgi:hypothetical protein
MAAAVNRIEHDAVKIVCCVFPFPAGFMNSMASVRKRGFFASNRFFLFKGLVFAMLAITIWLLLNARNLQEFLDTYYKRNREAERVAMLKQRIHTLEGQQRGLRENGFEAERQVRERFFYHLPGEKVIHLVPESEKDKVAAAQALQTSATLATPTPKSADGTIQQDAASQSGPGTGNSTAAGDTAGSNANGKSGNPRENTAGSATAGERSMPYNLSMSKPKPQTAGESPYNLTPRTDNKNAGSDQPYNMNSRKTTGNNLTGVNAPSNAQTARPDNFLPEVNTALPRPGGATPRRASAD